MPRHDLELRHGKQELSHYFLGLKVKMRSWRVSRRANPFVLLRFRRHRLTSEPEFGLNYEKEDTACRCELSHSSS